MFRKLVAIEPVGLVPAALEKLEDYAAEVVMYDDVPAGDDAVVSRIADADAVLLSYTSRITAEVLSKCPSVRYVGMCCSLYSPESANVDILYAREHGNGIAYYLCLHGFGQSPWYGEPRESTGLRTGFLGLGKSGGMIADALKSFGAEICYFSRNPKPEAEAKGYVYLPLDELLVRSEAVFCCLNKNTVLLHEAQFGSLGNGKMLFNTGLSPAWDMDAFVKWLDGDNLCCCDTTGALGDASLAGHANVSCPAVSTGRTAQAAVRLSRKVLENISAFLSVAGK